VSLRTPLQVGSRHPEKSSAAPSLSCHLVFVVPLVLALALQLGAAFASAPPVGAVPAGPVIRVTAPKGTLIAVALPRRSGAFVWRLARNVDNTVLEHSTEAEVGRNVVVVFRAVGRGQAKVVFALTRGETSHAYASVTHVVQVR
jgi:hypothetical protein